MHYRHGFHAGNFADVFKHVALCGLLSALNRKDKPWCYLDTHAGAGRYQLGGAAADRTGEWHDGIARLYGLQDAPPPLAGYLDLVRRFNGGGPLAAYPGSPWLAAAQARAADRLVLCEKVPEVAGALREAMGRDSRAVLHRRDGYESYALLPPAEKRGLVLVDPPFERPDEFDAMAEFLDQAARRFAGGIYALWYPIKNRHAAAKFLRRVGRIAAEGLALEFEVGAPEDGHMRACGMAVANPPFGFREAMEPCLKVLVRELGNGPQAKYRITPLTP